MSEVLQPDVTETAPIDIDQLDAILEGKDTEPEMAQEAEPQAEETQEAADEVTEQAETPDSSDIDYDLEVPMPDGGDPIKLGDMKDRIVEYQRKEADFITRENEIMRQRDELSQAMQAAQVEITPELREQMTRQQTAHLQREHEAMIAAIPEMADKTGFDNVRGAVQRVFEQYGAGDVVNQVMDHRLIKMAYDLDRLQQKEQQAAETQPLPKAKKRVGSKPGKQPAQLAAAHKAAKALKASDEGKLTYIDELLGATK